MNFFQPKQNDLTLEAHDLTCVRGEKTLFSQLNLSIAAGQCLHVRGANGVGKTSLLRLLAGLSKPEMGEVFFSGNSIHQNSETYRRQVLFLGHRDALKEDLTALENIMMFAALDDVALSTEQALRALRSFGLKGREDLPVHCLSAGQKKRVLMARIVTRNARLWILDEPFNALDVGASQILRDLIATQLQENGLVILTSHQDLLLPDLLVCDL
jgi:heme exporter protein A